MADPVIFENYQPKFIWSDVQAVKTIYQGNGQTTFHYEGATYTVPAGRKAYFIEWQVADRSATWGFDLQYYDSGSASWITIVQAIQVNPNVAGDWTGPPVFPVFKELAAGDQLRGNRTGGASEYSTLVGMVVEVST